ncbi:MAG: hypothetical protein PVJ84_07160 [Desulfobacteraceae bacterium]|jgi:hypothetical protein
MKQSIFKFLPVLACLGWMVFFWGCAGRSYLIVDYKVPAASQQLNGQTFQLRIEDHRETKEILTPNAADQFNAFNDRFSLAWIMADKERVLAGEHDVLALFKTAFQKRMALLGTDPINHGGFQAPVLTVSLEEFTIDLKDHKWIAKVGYRAALTKEGYIYAKERIRGNAERVRVLGRKGADLVISEIFTDVVNRLDIPKLFRKAELID